jgi:hypothetical protein
MFPRLLICEGPEDHLFFQKLIEVRNLPRCHIQAAGGNTQFASAISKFELEKTSVFRQLTDIIVVADNDDNPSASFENARAEIRKALGAGSAPRRPLQPTTRKPRCTVLMIPWTNVEGNLESLCEDAARDADAAVGGHVDTFLALAGSDRWASPSRRGKAWLRSNLAVRCEVDPFVPLGRIFNERRYIASYR